MTPRWKFFVGPGGAFQDSGTAALTGNRIAVGATPNLLFGLGAATGGLDWASQTGADAFAYQPLTAANGVLYAINDVGSLLAYDASTGVPLADRSIALDGGHTQCTGAGAGVAVARGTVFAQYNACGLTDVAGAAESYSRLPSPTGCPGRGEQAGRRTRARPSGARGRPPSRGDRRPAATPASRGRLSAMRPPGGPRPSRGRALADGGPANPNAWGSASAGALRRRGSPRPGSARQFRGRRRGRQEMHVRPSGPPRLAWCGARAASTTR